MSRLATLGFVIAAAALTAAGQLTITTTTVPTATLGQQYPNVVLQSSGDPGPITWSFVEGGPPNFTVGNGTNTTGLFCYAFCSGTIVQTPPGQYFFTVVATSPSGAQAFQDLTLFVIQPLQIVTMSLPNANANQSYQVQMQSLGGSGNIVWSILNGTLPPGIGLVDSVKGVIGGTAPGVNGTYSFTVQLMDQSTGTKVTQGLSITVVGGIVNVTITSTALPDATVNQPYTFQFTATGANLVWSLPAGSTLPSGFTLSSGGLLTGVGLGTGLFTIPVQVKNAQAPAAAASGTFSLAITLGPLGIVETSLPSAHQNVPYTAKLTPAGGIPPYTFGLGVGSPAGLSIDSTTGMLSGTLTSGGSFPVQVNLRDSRGVTVSQAFTLNVGNGVAITTSSLPNGSPNVAYSSALAATGGELTYKWNVLSGSLPPGLSLDQASGLISGTPTAQGAFQFTVQVTDFVGGTDSRTYIITIGTVQPLTITTSSLIGAVLNQFYTSPPLVATGGTQPITAWTIPSGNLPTGLTLNRSTGLITGTPTVSQSSTFTVQALDSARGTTTKSFTLTVASAVTITATSFTTPVGVAVSQTATAGGGVPPYTFTISIGSLPAGLQLGASTGVISGTPAASGSFPFTLVVTDSQGRTANTTISITVNSLPLTVAVSGGTGSSQQPGVGVSISAPTTGDINGTLTLAFAPSVPGTDNMVRFAPSGTQSVPFTIPQGQTTAPNVTVVTGTVAGTITITAKVAGNADVIKTIVIAPAVPVISSVVLQQVTGGLNVVVTGYSNTREVSSGSFTFTVASGNTLSQATIPVTLTSAYSAWFGTTSSNDTGGQFKLTVPFSVTQGTAAAVTKVSVTLTNAQGASAAVSSQ